MIQQAEVREERSGRMALVGPDGKPAATEVVQPYAESDRGQMQLAELETSQPRAGSEAASRDRDFH